MKLIQFYYNDKCVGQEWVSNTFRKIELEKRFNKWCESCFSSEKNELSITLTDDKNNQVVLTKEIEPISQAELNSKVKEHLKNGGVL